MTAAAGGNRMPSVPLALEHRGADIHTIAWLGAA
jgi:hypothetical protein